MALALGTNCGFVTSAPVDDPGAIGSTLDNNALGTRDTSPATATRITEIGWWCDGATEEANFEVGVYTETGGNYPGDVVGSLYQTNAKGTTAGWKRVTVDITISPNTQYWVAVQLDDTTTATNTDVALTGGDYRVLKPTQATLTDPFVADASTNSGYMFAFYMVWDTGGAPATGTNQWVNIDDTWRQITEMWVNIDDTWRKITEMWANINDTWRKIDTTT